jgi:hypothetical protein
MLGVVFLVEHCHYCKPAEATDDVKYLDPTDDVKYLDPTCNPYELV